MAIQHLRSGNDDFVPQTFSNLLDRFFYESMSNRSRLNRFVPAVDTCETDQAYTIEVALPGLKKEDIHLEFQQGQLTISGERQFKNEQKDRQYHLVESTYGSFSRSFQLPDVIDPAGIEAVFENGILCVTVPKDQRKTARHRIEVREGSSQNIQIENQAPAEAEPKASAEKGAKKKEKDMAHA